MKILFCSFMQVELLEILEDVDFRFEDNLKLIESLFGNCEEELPKKPVGQLSVNCRPSVDRQVTDSLPTANQQVTDRLRNKENCGKHEQLT